MSSRQSTLGIVGTVVALLLAVPLVVMPLASLAGGDHGPMGGAWWMMLMPAIPIGVVAVGVWLAVRAGETRSDADAPSVSEERATRQRGPLAELRTAYARGDLTDEEFESRRRTLQRRLEDGVRTGVSTDE
jgi:putative membrane protein